MLGGVGREVGRVGRGVGREVGGWVGGGESRFAKCGILVAICKFMVCDTIIIMLPTMSLGACNFPCV